MTKEEQIRKIFQDAQEQVMAVLFSDDRLIAEASANIDATADKIMKDSFDAKTLLIDDNNIDVSRYEMLDVIPDNEILELFDSCKKWCTLKEDDGKYSNFCDTMSKMRGTTLEDEMEINVNCIILKSKKINVDRSRSINREAKT